MSTVGQIIRLEDKVILSFGVAEAPVSYVSVTYTDTYHIGINLDTGKFDDIKSLYYYNVQLHDLTEVQQATLAKYLPVLHVLRKNVMTISAKARSGKDFLAETVQYWVRNVKLVALGDAIRDVRTTLYGESKGKDRAPLIMIGQGLRKEDANVWIKAWLYRVTEQLLDRKIGKFICPDVRQPNEFSFFRSLGATTVKIVADGEKRLNMIRKIDGEAALDEKLLNDETESHAGGFNADITVENDYTDSFRRAILDTVVSALTERGW